ncbi:MAG: sel1 repeat family protein, partial [Muribaculaceae bacterium]|nr:sel1 repeat family protein [Muribaculaceae bacterium]
MYYTGKGVPQNYTEAVKLYRMAAEHGNSSAQSELGWMYHNGYGVPQDYSEAVKWYRKGAEQGNAMAQNNLGSMYYNGYGVAQNYTEALKWYRKAAEQGNARAMDFLGWMYENGYGVTKSSSLARRWYEMTLERDPDYAPAWYSLIRLKKKPKVSRLQNISTKTLKLLVRKRVKLFIVVAKVIAALQKCSKLDFAYMINSVSKPDDFHCGHGYVDLGLESGLKWATCNIGTSSPIDCGNYYAWGETFTKSNYNEDTNNILFRSFCTEMEVAGIISRYGKGNLTTSHDAARCNWGGRWRMPTCREIGELQCCRWTWISQRGHRGYRVTG